MTSTEIKEKELYRRDTVNLFWYQFGTERALTNIQKGKIREAIESVDDIWEFEHFPNGVSATVTKADTSADPHPEHTMD